MGIPGADPRLMDAGLRPPPMDAGSRNMMGGGMSGMRRPADLMQPPMGPSAVDAGLRPPPMSDPTDAGARTMMGGDVIGARRPADFMQPPMGPSAVSTGNTSSSVPMSTTSATDLLSGRPGGMVESMATTPGSVILGQPQPNKSDDQPPLGQVPPAMPPPGSGPPPPTTKKPEPLPPPRMLDDDEERALLQGRSTVPPPRRPVQHASSSERPSFVPNDPEPTGTESRSRGRDEGEAVEVATTGRDACTACEAGGPEFRAGKKCPHAFCVSCVQSYFSRGETECPVCGIKDELTGRTLTQPASGHMLTTYENGFKLPGFETASRGTIIVTYSFPAGIQTVSIDFLSLLLLPLLFFF